ncbi:protein of unknown function DUF29 [Candidatus Magnetoovum chiemensis]|nr:protein of unknown function DUF29 [Candidatus Magnetoovum chiemensis]
MSNIIQEPVEQAYAMKEQSLKEQSLYERDFYQWSLKTAELIRQGRFAELDIENIAEEIESLGRKDKRELKSRLAVLIMHLLKWQHQSNKRSDSWKTTIRTQRKEIRFVIEDSPSLQYGIEETIDKAFIEAKIDFEDETRISKKILPEVCPYTWEQLSDDDFMPKPLQTQQQEEKH